ncbi:hypothetical protein [Gluconobacter thailandicus]|uniref:Uncharacterized protein n=1 Tax=Gluconobacter thailandicus TaxID=257438 RepID=A0AAP9JIZ4_GLUTH|nr:hypothetical protein [Gluconobacter thailandicus]QEH97833.1 hypothetical protein FXF46_16205 [Gluconobacter thailandicus]
MSGKSGTSVTTHDQTYGSLPTPQEIKDLLAGLSGKQIGSSGQELTSGVDYWKNSTGIEDLKNKISLPVNTGSSDLKVSNSRLHIVSLMATNEADMHKLATGAGGDSGVEAGSSENVSVEGHSSGGGFIGGTSGGGTGNNEPSENIHVTGHKYLTVHGLSAEEINGKIFLRGPDGKGLLTEKNNDGSYSSQPIETVEKDLKQITQDIYGRDPTDDDYKSYNNLLQNSKSPQEARGSFSHSDEAKSKVNSVYQKVFARDVDNDGLKTQLDAMGRDLSIKGVQNNIAHSSEAENRLKAAISDIQGRTATDDDKPWINGQEDALGNDQISLNDIYKGTATWTGEHGGYNSIIKDVQDRTPTSSDANWIRGVEDSIGNRRQNYQQVRTDLVNFAGEIGVINPNWQNVLGRDPTQSEIDKVRSALIGGSSIREQRTILAHSAEAKSILDDAQRMFFKLGSLPVNDAWTKWAQDTIGEGNGQNLSSMKDNLLNNNQALVHIDSFLNKEFGNTSQDNISSAKEILSNILQGYESLKQKSAYEIKSIANAYTNQFASGDNLIKSMMPQTAEQWLGLTAMLALTLTPPGEVALVGEIAVLGGDELLGMVLDTELDTATIYQTNKAAVSVFPPSALSAIDELNSMQPSSSDGIIQLDENTKVSQISSNKYQMNNIEMKGGNEESVKNYFKKVTGFDGDLNSVAEKIGQDGVIYKINTPRGYVSLRDVSKSGKDWTIQFQNPLGNGVKKIKFNFGE